MASVIALILNWKLSLVGMVFIPIVLAGSYFQCKVIMGQSAIEMKSLDKANKVSSKQLSNNLRILGVFDQYFNQILDCHRSYF